MIDKNGGVNIKNEISNQKTDIYLLVERKIHFFYDVIQRTILHVQKNKNLDILGISDVNNCIEKLNEINEKIKTMKKQIKINMKTDNLINDLQNINNDLSGLLKNYGTEKLEDLLLICFGVNNKITKTEDEVIKLELLKKYFHPTSYKVVNKKDEVKNKKINTDKNADKQSDDKNNNMDCVDISNTVKNFHLKVYGLKVNITNTDLNKSLIVFGIVDDIIIDYLNDSYILEKKDELKLFYETKKIEINNYVAIYKKFIESLTLKDYLICITNEDFYKKFIGIVNHINSIKQKQIAIVIKEFMSDDMFLKRNTLIDLLIHSENCENQYLSYLLYDLLSNELNGNVDTQEQTILYDSFPWVIKESFKNSMKKTIQYTNELSNFDINKIPIEQQICLLKVPDSVKEKAMIKLKEVKAKSEDSGSKARQYLDGLLKIPFGVYKKEEILNYMEDIRKQFKELVMKYNLNKVFEEIAVKDKYTSVEVFNYIIKLKNIIKTKEKQVIYDKLKNILMVGDKKKLHENIVFINEALKKHNIKNNKIKYTTVKKDELISYIEDFLLQYQPQKEPEQEHKEHEEEKEDQKKEIIKDLYNLINPNIKDDSIDYSEIVKEIDNIDNKSTKITDYFVRVKQTLDKSVYGHNNAKRQVERILAQWINGEQKGYACGFEGPPGVGKTSLAKGLADCLKDENGVSRPFSLIALGGDSNASSLIGHSYTYVGSTWGQIVQILMDKKCMNPVILIDEVDKISKTEHGKEIIGVLTHLLDPTQNDTFQDKYFSGVDFDISKILFILSYNDVTSIDRIMLDRVNRIKFDNLSLEDKIIICNKHLLPDIYKSVGLEEMIHFSNDVLKYIIEEYTLEAGVRKLKEILFEIIGEINLEILQLTHKETKIPLNISIEDIKTKYLKDKREQITRKVFNISKVGFVNGMYATVLGNGGTLPIHAQFYPSDKFLELKLTGLQQEVMRESMHVALTVAWNLTTLDKQNIVREQYDNIHKCGINIHTGDGSVQKDGPSAGCAITCAIYSLLNNVPLKPEFGITGEIQMSGEVTAIGGLSSKILGSIKSSVKHFIYPKENQRDFDDFIKKYKDNDIVKNVEFYPVENVNEALKLLLDE